MKINNLIHPNDFHIAREPIMKCKEFSHLEYIRSDHHSSLAEALVWSQSLSTPVSIMETSQHTYIALPGSIGEYKAELKQWLEDLSGLTWENTPAPDTVVFIHKDNLMLDRRPRYTLEGDYTVILLEPPAPEDVNFFSSIYEIGDITVGTLWDLTTWATNTGTCFIALEGSATFYGTLPEIE